MNWRPWLHGLAAAFIGGGSSAVSAGISGALVKPEAFNMGTEMVSTLKLMAGTFLVSGLLSAFFYLKASPLPPVNVGTADGGDFNVQLRKDTLQGNATLKQDKR